MSGLGTAVVTGAAQGIGRAVAERLLADGYEVLAVDVNADQIAHAAAELGCRGVALDVTNDEQVASLAAIAPECTALVNNAAIQRYQDLLRTTHDEMRLILDVNVIAPVLAAQALVPVMSGNGGGSIVNLSSITSKAHPASTSLYPTSKAAINQLTQAMALEFGPHGVRCNAVGPGTVLTEGTAEHYGPEAAQALIAGCLPISRMGMPQDIANAISWFCSPEASWVTGQVLFVDGGYTSSHGQFFRWARKAPK
jgi:3-oxoacyl-[acyl-carrier protein] reductase